MNVCGKSLPPAAAALLGTNTLLLVLGVPLLLALHASISTSGVPPAAGFAELLIRLCCIGLFCQMVFYYAELYHLEIARSLRDQIWRIFGAIGFVMLCLAGVFRMFPSLSPGRDALLGLPVGLMAVLLATRQLALAAHRARVVIIGPQANANSLAEGMKNYPEWNLEIAGMFTASELEQASLPEATERILVCQETQLSPELTQRLIELKLRGMRIEPAAQFLEIATGRVQLEEVAPKWFVFSDGFDNNRRKLFIKRCFDLICAAVLLVITSPIMALAVAAILLEGKGPLFYPQKRVGVYGRVFQIYKFRTMVPAPAGEQAQWTAHKDKRITRLGQIMRTFRIDELPQLLNILRGEMSLVGPRPEQPHYCEMLAKEIPFYHQRHTVPPGLTGWAQVRFRYGASIEESRRKLEYDLFYVKNLSLWLDLVIVFETIKVVVTGHGAK